MTSPKSIGLALSGGGFRATLYHLGVIRCLRDNGWLPQVSYICSVSGGSVLAGHLVLNWEKYTGDDGQFEEAAQEIVRFSQWDLRGRIVRRFGGKPFRSGTETLVKYLDSELYHRALLSKLNDGKRPEIHILATNTTRGGLADFSAANIILGPAWPEAQKKGAANTPKEIQPGSCSLAMAVAASAAFPGFFRPLKLKKKRLHVSDAALPHPEFFTDGGVFDNFGLHRLEELAQLKKPELKLVSNARGAFGWHVQERTSLLSNAIRSTDIMMERIRVLEFAHAEATDQADRELKLINLKTVVNDVQDDWLPQIQERLEGVRTDFDRFSKVEIDALVRHGFAVTREILGLSKDRKAWSPVSNALPSQEQQEASLANHIKVFDKSRERKWGFFNWRDGLSLAQLALVLMLVYVALCLGWPSLAPGSGTQELFRKARTTKVGVEFLGRTYSIPFGSMSAPRSDSLAGQWVGEIVWLSTFAKEHLIKDEDVVEPTSTGTMVISRDSKGKFKALSTWELFNSTTSMARLAVEPQEIATDEKGRLLSCKMVTFVRSQGTNFSYGSNRIYRIKLTNWTDRSMAGTVEHQTDGTFDHNPVGQVRFTKNP